MENDSYQRPSADQLRAELARELHKESRRESRSVVFFYIIGIIALLVVALIILFPIRRVGNDSMAPAYEKGSIVIIDRFAEPLRGDVILYEYGNKTIVNRVIGVEGDSINIDEDGTVYLNDEPLEEDYVKEKSLGNCNIELPFIIPPEKYFVLGDDRVNAEDSRDSKMWCVDIDQLVGKIIYTVKK